MGMPTSQEFRRRTAKDDVQAKQKAEVDRLRARVQKLKNTNDALGKAIGLLHQMNEQESDAATPETPTTSTTSSPPKTNSFGISIENEVTTSSARDRGSLPVDMVLLAPSA